MNILVVGNGAREHAIIWKIRKSPKTDKVFCTIGNAGINEIAEAVNIKPDDISSLLDFVQTNKVDFTIVGPEVPLSLGIVDEFKKHRLKIFGPSRTAARLETSKVFAKEFMRRYDVPTAKFRSFDLSSEKEVNEFLSNSTYPVVIKADGLAGGKGVVICEDEALAKDTIKEFFQNKIFGKAGEKVVIEEFLKGSEASVFAITDGTDYVILPPAQDHKRILDGEKGKNTGGMGSFASGNKLVTTEVLDKIKERIIVPVLKYMKAEGSNFQGCLYCGLMIDEKGNPYVVEFNTRFGDPETQVVLPLIKSDFLNLLLASSEAAIKGYTLNVSNGYYCSVVLASKGYPDKYETGKEITGLDEVSDDCFVFHAGTEKLKDGRVVTNGGRVLNVVGISDKSLKDAIDAAYRNIEVINYENKYYRRDIGLKGL
jgi:phosphoribosylamine---glycine ligase